MAVPQSIDRLEECHGDGPAQCRNERIRPFPAPYTVCNMCIAAGTNVYVRSLPGTFSRRQKRYCKADTSRITFSTYFWPFGR
jgi:hypothetical protein